MEPSAGRSATGSPWIDDASPPGLRRTDTLIGVDDTDWTGGRSTGQLVDTLVAELSEVGLGQVLAVTRHQLLADGRVPSTSGNVATCVALHAGRHVAPADVARCCADFLTAEASPGSDPGLAVVSVAALTGAATAAVVDFGGAAQRAVVTVGAAREVAGAAAAVLVGPLGEGRGVIGALAAVGLHLGGDDGTLTWLAHGGDIEGPVRWGHLRSVVALDDAVGPDGTGPSDVDIIAVDGGLTVVLAAHRAVLLLDPPQRRPGPDGTEVDVWPVTTPAGMVAHRGRHAPAAP